MIIRDNIHGKVFLEQRTYYVYNSEEDWSNDKPSVVTSNEEKFKSLKKTRMKIKEINGELYSRIDFDEYKLRVIVEFFTFDEEIHKIDIYTTQVNKDQIQLDMLELVNHDKVKSFNIVHTATKEQDDAAAEFIEETLNDW